MWSETGPGGQEPALTFIERARRKQIVEATIEVLAEVGYGKASLALIAKRAGISKGVISYHFKGKANLLDQVEAAIDSAMEAAIAPRIELEESARGQLHAFVRAYLEYVRDHRSHLLALIEIFFMHARSDGRRPMHESFGYEEVYQGMEEILRFGQREGEFLEFDTRAMAVMLWGAIEGVSTEWATNPELDLDHYIDEVITLLDRVILKPQTGVAPMAV